MRENDDAQPGDEPELEPAGDDELAGDELADDELAGDAPADDDAPSGDDEPAGDDELADDEPDAAAEAAAERKIANELSDRAIKAREKALEREYSRHEGALERAYGTLWPQFQICPLCEGDGFMVPRPAGSMPDEQLAAVLAFAGTQQPVELPADQDYAVCDNCKGWGATAIAGSSREGLSKQCDRCLGNGYMKSTNVTQLPAPVQIPGPVPVPVPVAIPSYGSPEPADQWGRPAGHVHYGIPPAAVT